MARWLSSPSVRAPRLEKLTGAPIHARVVAPSASFDPHAAICIVKVGGIAIEARASSLAVRALAQRVIGGPEELAAPRPLNLAEESIWSLVVASALEDLGIPGKVWPGPLRPSRGYSAPKDPKPAPNPIVTGAAIVELELQCGQLAFAIQLHVPSNLELRVPPRASAPVPAWAEQTTIEVPIILGRCAIHRNDLAQLRVRSLVTLEPAGPPTKKIDESRYAASRQGPIRGADLEILGGFVTLRAQPDAVVAEVATGYVRRDMALPDDAHVELTVALGTTQLSLRQVLELSVGQVVQLGRPLAGRSSCVQPVRPSGEASW